MKGRLLQHLPPLRASRCCNSSRCIPHNAPASSILSKAAATAHNTLQKPCFPFSLPFSLKHPFSQPHYYLTYPRLFNTSSTFNNDKRSSSEEHQLQSEWEEEGETDGWEEEEEAAEAKIGDGGDGGGVVLQGVPWGERALSIAHEVLLQFGDDMELFSFKTTPRGYVYVRLDKLSNE